MIKKFILAVVTALSPIVVNAEFRCPTTSKIVKEGMNQYEVESACGAANAKKVTQQSGVDAQGRSVPLIEEWTYDFGPSSFMRFLVFQGGSLVSVKTGGYGNPKESASKTGNPKDGNPKNP